MYHTAENSVVYMIHFFSPLHHARHYMGVTYNLEARLAEHRAGTGAKLMAAIKKHGIGWTVARTWKGGKDLERLLKNRKNGPKMCPICIQQQVANKVWQVCEIQDELQPFLLEMGQN